MIGQILRSLYFWNPRRIKIVGRGSIYYKDVNRAVTLTGEYQPKSETSIVVHLGFDQRWDRPPNQLITKEEKLVIKERIEREIPKVDGVRVAVEIES